MKNKVIAVSVADANNLKYFEMMKNSLRKFHTEEELPLALIGPDQLKLNPDPSFFYRATPMLGNQFLNIEGYDTVIKLDADQIITSDLNHILKDKEDYDVGTVLNDLPLRVWDIQTYYNCGMVVMKSREFVKHWLDLCFSPHFDRYQYREQDILSILTSDYFKYKVKCYDLGDRLNGLIAKPSWIKCYMDDNKIMLDAPTGKKQLSVIHFAGGNSDPAKGNYKIKFQPDVVKYIDSLIKP